MGELDRIAWALCCHVPSMPSLLPTSRLVKFKLTHYQSFDDYCLFLNLT